MLTEEMIRDLKEYYRFCRYLKLTGKDFEWMEPVPSWWDK